MSDDWGFADIYSMDDDRGRDAGPLEDVGGDDWRNILVLGRATKGGVFPETLALVGRARHLADALGCRVEVLLIGTGLDAATQALQQYPLHTIYRVAAPDYAPIDHTARILEQVVRKRRPELVLVFQSRTGDAVTAYAAERLGVGFAVGASAVEMDTMERRAVVTHTAGNHNFQIVTRMEACPQFVSVQRGLFRAPMEDPYASPTVHDIDVDIDPPAAVEVVERGPPPASRLETADRVVVVGARVSTREEVEAAQRLAEALGAAFGVTLGIVERGLMETEAIVGEHDRHIRPRLLVTVGVRGSLDFLQAIEGEPTIAAVGCDPEDPIARRAAYVVPGDVAAAVQSVLDAL